MREYTREELDALLKVEYDRLAKEGKAKGKKGWDLSFEDFMERDRQKWLNCGPQGAFLRRKGLL